MRRVALLLVVMAVGAVACSVEDAPSSVGSSLPDTSTSIPEGSTPRTPATTRTSEGSPVVSTTVVPTTDPGIAAPSVGVTAIGDEVDGPGTFHRSLLVGDDLRNYTLHVSEGAWRAAGAPLVLDLHGLGSSADAQESLSGFRLKADAEGFVVAQPEASGVIPAWQAGPSPSPDVDFLLAVILDVGFQVDIGPVFVAGFSNGGGMAHRLACDAPEAVTAVGTVAGAYPDVGPCRSAVPVVAFHGELDPVVPFHGAGDLLPDIAEWAASWADRAGCDSSGTLAVSDDVDLTRWEGCSPEVAVELYVVANGRHGWPGTSSPLRLLDSTRSISATGLMWRFFERFAPSEAG